PARNGAQARGVLAGAQGMVNTRCSPFHRTVTLSWSMAITFAFSIFSPINRLLPLITTEGRDGCQTMPWTFRFGKVGTLGVTTFVVAGGITAFTADSTFA